MRALALATVVLVAASGLYPSFAQEQQKAQGTAPQTAPAQAGQNAASQQDQQSADQGKGDDREVGRDWRVRPRDGDDRDRSDYTGRDDREVGRDWRMQRDREAGRDRDMDSDRYRQRADRDWDRRDSSRYRDERPRRRVKVCIEYPNGDEYCRYRD
jgi:hypothetical protein